MEAERQVKNRHLGRFYLTGDGGSDPYRSRAGGEEWIELGGRTSRTG